MDVEGYARSQIFRGAARLFVGKLTSLNLKLKWLLASLLFVSSLLMPSFGLKVQAYADDYPSQWRDAAMDSMMDSWKEYNRECTSFVAWRLHARNGFEVPFYGNAADWKSMAAAQGYTVNSSPAVGSVAWT